MAVYLDSVQRQTEGSKLGRKGETEKEGSRKRGKEGIPDERQIWEWPYLGSSPSWASAELSAPEFIRHLYILWLCSFFCLN